MVATDDKRIYNTVRSFWGNIVMTSKKHKSGTDRIGEVVKRRTGELKHDIVVNIQGDEPFIEPKNIDKAVEVLIKDKSANVSTLACKINHQDDLVDPNIVKVAFDKNHYAIDFSRQIISSPVPVPRFAGGRTGGAQYKHIGLYAFRKDYLMKFIKMKQSKRERAEKLEQLRILENGDKIKVVITRKDSISIDTKEDLKKYRR